nr:PAS domain S-box protein [uncultured Dongia sp.]
MNAPTVMVVEDERIVALNLCRTLTRLGYNASTIISNGIDALRHIAETRPDIVLMDIHIDGDMDGIETAARIPENLMLPVIYLTAYSEDATLDRARTTKPYGYLVKPFSERELHATITMALQRRVSDVAVRESEERLRLALAAAELGSWEVDPDTGQILCKDHEGWLSDATPRLVAESFREFLPTVHRADQDLVRAAFNQVSTQSELCEVEFRKPAADGSERWFRVIGKTFASDTDRRRRLLGVVRDITALKQKDQEQRASEQSYRALISSIDGIVWEADPSRNRITYVSDSAERVLGYSPEQWMTEPLFWERRLHRDDAAQAIAEYTVAIAAGQSYASTYRMIDSKGDIVWMHEVVSAILRDGLPVLMRGVIIDITDLKKAETEIALASQRLAESEQRLAAILDTAAIGIVTVDEKFRIISFNREAENIFGYTAEATIGKTLEHLLPDSFRDRHQEQMRGFLRGDGKSRAMGSWRTVTGLAADGRIIPLATIISQVSVGGRTTLTAIMRDMTETQKSEAELRRLLNDREIAVATAEAANMAKSSFLAVMSHELRTPLNAIIGFSELMGQEVMGPIGNEHYRQYIADIHQSGQLLLTHVNSILDLSRIESGRHELNLVGLGFADVWDQVAGTLTVNALTKGVALQLEDINSDVRFRGDRNAVAQVLLNLVSNAIKFTPAGGKIDIGLANTGRDKEVAIFVRDNGRGIPADRLTDVLKPFVQVSDTYARDTGGVGLGLAICKSLVEAMSGRIAIDSTLGQGTTVRVFLPRWTDS